MTSTSPPASTHHARIPGFVLAVLGVSFVLRALAGGLLELGNDEVYYTIYARYPGWSHFDHPPMVGWMAQVTTLNVWLTHEFFFRLGPVILGTVNALLMYRIAERIGGRGAGINAALLFTASVYGSVLAGALLLPDPPLVTFWLLATWSMLRAFEGEPGEGSSGRWLVAAGAFAGLAMMSKYQALLLVVGGFGYVLLFDRRWLRVPQLWLGGVLAGVIASPILLWNAARGFPTMTYHGARVTPEYRIRFDLFFTEIGGEIGYQNPFVWVVMVMAMVWIARGRVSVPKMPLSLLLSISLPLLFAAWGISLFRGTLPHWNGPAYLGLIILTSVALADRFGEPGSLRQVLWRVKGPAYLVGAVLILAVGVINHLPANLGRTEPPAQLGSRDGTLDMFGMRQIRDGVADRLRREGVPLGEAAGDRPPALLSFRWFPGAHLDHYLADPIGMRMLVEGPSNRTHEYIWVNEDRGRLEIGEDAFHVAVSNWYGDPLEYYGDVFDDVYLIDRIPVYRSGVHVKNAFLYRLVGYNGGEFR
jgi:hypothetical protein